MIIKASAKIVRNEKAPSILAECEIMLRDEAVGELTIRGCRIIDGKNGPFVSLPQREYEKQGETKYFRFIKTSTDMEKAIQEAALKAFSEASRNKGAVPAGV